ncbi:MAG TPA: YggS family pyridoxal phosphate-dependent enzyme [Haliangiales bacterium]|nr:YggS family pyridoxal phosphate-dependent enzyme [Haliangiales bacterium]
MRLRIAAACARAGRPESAVTLCAVSKTHPAPAVREAHAAGLRDFGENYVQELLPKAAELADLDLRWHYVGHLQRNKAKDVVGRVALVHGVDSLALAEALDRRAAAPLDVLVQVNAGDEDSKAGVAWDEVPALVAAIRRLARVRCRGLMAIPPPSEDNRPRFRRLAELAASLDLPELSMGMSDDFEAAIEEGATIVRIGTAIFGARA